MIRHPSLLCYRYSVSTLRMEVQRCTRSMGAKARLVNKCVIGEVASLDDSKNHSSKPGSLSQDLTARLMCLQKCNELDNLTMPELRSIMKQIGKSFSGRKKELLVVLNRFLMEYASGKIGTTSPIEQGLLYKNDVGLENKNPECALLEDVHSKQKNPESVSCEVVVESATAKLVDSSIAQKRQRVRKGKKALATEDGREAAMLSTEPWAVLVHKKVQPGWVPYNPFFIRAAGRQPDDRKHLKLISWNVNGLRALVKQKNNSEQDTLILSQLASLEDFDIISLQETKLQEKDVENMRTILPNYKYSFWTCSVTKLGYSGTALISRVKPASVTYGLGVPGHDSEGRLITADFGSFFLVTAYVPNSGEKLQRLAYRTEEWDPALSSYLKELEKEKPVVLTGDLNCAHQEIDIYHPDGNRRSAGFTDEERASFESHFLNKGFVDSFRRKHPNAVAYTYWGYRSGARPQNRGWRLDYFLTSDSMFGHVHDSFTIPHVPGSDHCPIGLVLDSSFNQHRE